MRHPSLLLASLVLLAPTLAVSAEVTAASKRVPTPEEKAEKESRKACKIEICDILATKNPDGEDVSCDLVKTWREADIVKMLGGRINWPWGKAVCHADIALKREHLAKAMSEPSYEVALPAQTARCTLEQKTDGAPYAIQLSMEPRVTFENGKATAAAANWGEASAPMLIYPLIYAGTGLDNSSNVLGPELVRLVNEFTTKKCAEVKSELPSSRP
jgi:hypothetical protein